MKKPLALGVVVGALTLGACGTTAASSSATTTSAVAKASSAAAPQVVDVTIRNFAFSPSTITVAAGGEIKVTNDDSVIHTFTATNHSFDTGNILPGKTVVVKVGSSSSGITESALCTIHQYMTATVKVVAA
ncbi:MAG: cupredoxin domain-containing protein [Actinomycetota bacterium]|nr:cupredoxin domain-containing protein [Actinomycetota bacterium]